jgi:CPA1 family monovalent cation:H+ antiporter
MTGTPTVIVFLVAVAAILEVLAARLDRPRPIVLVCGGLAIALLPGLPRVDFDPEALFTLFVPPLLYWAALNSSLRDFRVNAVVISVAGVLLVLATTVSVAWVLHLFVPSMPWAAAVVLGAIVAPPDAVVTLSMLCGMQLPRRVTTILLGESLINDAASLVVYRMAVAAVVVGGFSWTHGAVEFARAAVGGAGIGLGVGALMEGIRRRTGDLPGVQITMSLLSPFVAYLPADAAGASGILAVVVAGFYAGRKGPRVIPAESRIRARDTWAVVTFVLESLTFLLIGLDLPYAREALSEYSLGMLILYAGTLSAAIAAVRLVSAFPTAYLNFWLSNDAKKPGRPAPRWQNVLFFALSGLRGGDSLVVALTLPLTIQGGAPFPGRNLIIVLTFGIVLFSILVQGLSLRPAVKALGLRGDGLAEAEERDATHRVAEAGIAALKSVDAGPLKEGESEILCRVLRHLREMHATEPVSSSIETRQLAPPSNLEWLRIYQKLRTQMVLAERAELVRLRDQEVISDDVMNRLLHAADLEEVLLSTKMQAAMRHEASRQSP